MHDDPYEGLTALHIHAKSGGPRAMEAYLEAGYDVNAKDPKKLSENPLRATSRVVQAISASSDFHRARRA